MYLQKLAALHANGCKRMQSFHATGGQSHINCTQVAAHHMLIVSAWPPVACNMNKINRNLHATGGHAVQFACNWRPPSYNLHATGGHSASRQETSRQEVCKKAVFTSLLYFLALASSHPRGMIPTIQLTALGYLILKMCW